MAEALLVHQALVEALQRQAIDRGHQPVLISTGISSLLLIGEHAYKLRKPLNLGFLDFSSLEQRRIDCDTELVLNRRTAPALYLDVVAVQGPSQTPWFTPRPAEGPVLDWALCMRRFDPEDCFDRLAAKQLLRASHVEALAHHVARFHASLPPSPPAFGQPAQVLGWARDNLATLLGHALAAPWQSRLQALARWTDDEHARLAPLMAQRHAAGWVREGHGDLHLGNVLWQNGQALAFDAIEFNAGLRHLDVIGDIAFTWMDLHRQGLPHLAARLLNTYLQAMGDVGGLPLLRWHGVYRALVRAKVAMLRAAQAQTLGRDRERDLQAMARDIATAERLQRRTASKPCLIVTTGLSGSGKSTVAARLIDALGALCLRSDVERKRLFGLAPQDRGGAAIGLYSPEATERTYQRLDDLSRQAVQAGWPVIVDAACLKRRERDHFRQLAREAGADFVLLSCEAPEVVLRERIRGRMSAGHDASDADLAVLDQQLQWHEQVLADESPCRVRTDLIR